jgi:hypothetical protein
VASIRYEEPVAGGSSGVGDGTSLISRALFSVPGVPFSSAEDVAERKKIIAVAAMAVTKRQRYGLQKCTHTPGNINIRSSAIITAFFQFV